jgi:cell division protein FtsI/penicillin-binding protein 2
MLSPTRLFTLLSIIAVAMLVVVLRTMQVQVFAAVDYAAQVRNDQRKEYAMSAPRGRIFDRNGNVLAVSNRVYLVRFNPRAVTDTQTLASVVAPFVQEPVESIHNRMQAIIADQKLLTPTLNTALFYDLAPSTTISMMQAVQRARLGGIWDTPEEYWSRTYPQGRVAGTVLGFVNLQPRGYAGVEGYYNQHLDSAPGEIAEVGRQNLEGITLTQQGADVVLTLNMTLQRYVEDRLAQAMQDYGPIGGSIVVMDTRTGALLASASAPGFDPNRAIEIATSKNGDLSDPAVTALYEPGSVLKVLTAAAALESGMVTTSTIFTDTGKLDVGTKFIRNSDGSRHGPVTLNEMLRFSLNTVAAQMAFQLGPERFYSTFRKFGMGAKCGVDLAGEQLGTLRTPRDEQWSKSDLATNSYGQGMTASPLQVLAAVNAIANDGVLVQPFVVQQWRQADGSVVARQIVRVQQVVSVQTARTLRVEMVDATRFATPKAMLRGYSVAGKTGTADWYRNGLRQDSTYVTYVGMLPAAQPRITILVKFDRPRKEFRWAADSTVPVFRDVAEKAVQVLAIPPEAR